MEILQYRGRLTKDTVVQFNTFVSRHKPLDTKKPLALDFSWLIEMDTEGALALASRRGVIPVNLSLKHMRLLEKVKGKNTEQFAYRERQVV